MGNIIATIFSKINIRIIKMETFEKFVYKFTSLELFFSKNMSKLVEDSILTFRVTAKTIITIKLAIIPNARIII